MSFYSIVLKMKHKSFIFFLPKKKIMYVENRLGANEVINFNENFMEMMWTLCLQLFCKYQSIVLNFAIYRINLGF